MVLIRSVLGFMLLATAQAWGMALRLDYRGYVPATDSIWFYLAVPGGGGVAYSISGDGTFYDEFGEQAVGSFTGVYDAPAVVYVKGNAIKVRFYVNNGGGPADSGTISIAYWPGLGTTPTWATGGSVSFTVVWHDPASATAPSSAPYYSGRAAAPA